MKNNIFHSYALVFFILFLLTTASSCSKGNIVTPPELQPGRRDYAWTVDTLKPAEVDHFLTLFGTNAHYAWAVGLSYLNVIVNLARGIFGLLLCLPQIFKS